MSKEKVKIRAVCLPESLNVIDDPTFLANDENIRNAQFCEIKTNDADISFSDFKNILFNRCTFSKCSFERGSFENVIFRNCSFLNCSFSSCIFSKCLIEQSQFKGSSFANASLSDFCIKGSSMRYANFTSCDFHRCEISLSDMSESYFDQSNLENFHVNESQFIRTEFFQTPLKGIDFSDSCIDGICVSEECKELFGVIVNPLQACELSRLLGLIIKENNDE